MSLALAGVGAFCGRRSRFVWFFLLTTVVGLILALGDSTPAAHWVYHLPVFHFFRCPCRFLLWWTFGVAVLAGLGVHALQALPYRRGLMTLGVSCATLLAGVGFAWNQVSRQMVDNSLFHFAPSVARSPLPWENTALGLSFLGLLLSLPLLWAWITRRGQNVSRLV